MFEELLEHRKLQPTASKRSQLAHLTKAQIHANILKAVEEELQSALSTTQKVSLRRRITEEYAKRPLPEDMFETWHTTIEEENQGQEQYPERNSNGDGDLAAQTPTQKKQKTMKQPNTQEFMGGDFDMYVKNKLVTQTLAAKAPQEDPDLSIANRNQSGIDSTPSRNEISNIYQDSDSELELHQDAMYANKKLSELQKGIMSLTLQPRRQWAVDRFLIMSWGWEVPGAWQDASDYSLIKLHLRSLRLLLHASILKKQWKAAYKVLTVLLRFEFVDKRAIWPLALEILTQRKYELENLRSLLKTESNKEFQFLDWIQLSYPASRVKVIQKRTYQGPVYRSGSRTHAPLSLITGLWNLLIEQKYSRVRDDIDDLLLHPPYSTDGSYWFLLAMCCMSENVHLVKFYNKYDLCSGFFEDLDDCGDLSNDPGLLSSKESIKARIFSNNTQARKMLDHCDKLGFSYPKEEVEAQLNEAWTTLDPAEYSEVNEEQKGQEDIVSIKVKDTEKYFTLRNGIIAETTTKTNSIPQKFLSKFMKIANNEPESQATVEVKEMATELKGSSLYDSEASKLQADALDALNLLDNLLEKESNDLGVSSTVPVDEDVNYTKTAFTCLSDTAMQSLDQGKVEDKALQSPGDSVSLPNSSKSPVSTSGSERDSSESEANDSELVSQADSPQGRESMVLHLSPPKTPISSQNINRIEFFSPITPLPTQEFGLPLEGLEMQGNLKVPRKSQFSDSEAEPDNIDDQSAPQNLSEEDGTIFEDALADQSHFDWHPGSSDTEAQFEEHSQGNGKKTKNQKKKLSASTEMEFDFDFE